jgi:hypothetical protein
MREKHLTLRFLDDSAYTVCYPHSWQNVTVK